MFLARLPGGCSVLLGAILWQVTYSEYDWRPCESAGLIRNTITPTSTKERCYIKQVNTRGLHLLLDPWIGVHSIGEMAWFLALRYSVSH